MTSLSVNVNKFALIRNARGADMPNLLNISKKCIEYGADGITVHPRPDERHVKFFDLKVLKNITDDYEKIEFNIEGYPSDDFINRVIDVSPHQVTLVPDPPEALTSSFGWNCEENKMTIADISMWRLLGWLTSGIIDGIPTTIVDNYPKLKIFIIQFIIMQRCKSGC